MAALCLPWPSSGMRAGGPDLVACHRIWPRSHRLGPPGRDHVAQPGPPGRGHTPTLPLPIAPADGCSRQAGRRWGDGRRRRWRWEAEEEEELRLRCSTRKEAEKERRTTGSGSFEYSKLPQCHQKFNCFSQRHRNFSSGAMELRNYSLAPHPLEICLLLTEPCSLRDFIYAKSHFYP